jgi:hypothetical protein
MIPPWKARTRIKLEGYKGKSSGTATASKNDAACNGVRKSRQEGEGNLRYHLYNGPVPCDEYQRLEQIYFAALVENSKISLRRANMESETWREAANETRAACEATLSDLNKHRAEHGC